ncbi:hypothetical protein C7M84_005843 [Penaeus vannamei]|uniref:Uncharacterized protein n=1 Tax=Penaeus vannamei TaxID=6689 RepID=A0A423TGP0_PENVA|nr:hypothetical protein C7M84_005843 [Penaeus vannamei]
MDRSDVAVYGSCTSFLPSLVGHLPVASPDPLVVVIFPRPLTLALPRFLHYCICTDIRVGTLRRFRLSFRCPPPLCSFLSPRPSLASLTFSLAPSLGPAPPFLPSLARRFLGLLTFLHRRPFRGLLLSPPSPLSLASSLSPLGLHRTLGLLHLFSHHRPGLGLPAPFPHSLSSPSSFLPRPPLGLLPFLPAPLLGLLPFLPRPSLPSSLSLISLGLASLPSSSSPALHPSASSLSSLASLASLPFSSPFLAPPFSPRPSSWPPPFLPRPSLASSLSPSLLFPFLPLRLWPPSPFLLPFRPVLGLLPFSLALSSLAPFLPAPSLGLLPFLLALPWPPPFLPSPFLGPRLPFSLALTLASSFSPLALALASFLSLPSPFLGLLPFSLGLPALWPSLPFSPWPPPSSPSPFPCSLPFSLALLSSSLSLPLALPWGPPSPFSLALPMASSLSPSPFSWPSSAFSLALLGLLPFPPRPFPWPPPFLPSPFPWPSPFLPRPLLAPSPFGLLSSLLPWPPPFLPRPSLASSLSPSPFLGLPPFLPRPSLASSLSPSPFPFSLALPWPPPFLSPRFLGLASPSLASSPFLPSLALPWPPPFLPRPSLASSLSPSPFLGPSFLLASLGPSSLSPLSPLLSPRPPPFLPRPSLASSLSPSPSPFLLPWPPLSLSLALPLLPSSSLALPCPPPFLPDAEGKTPRESSESPLPLSRRWRR